MRTIYLLLVMQILSPMTVLCQGKVKLKNGNQTKTIKSRQPVVILGKNGEDLQPRVRIYSIVEEGIVFIKAIDTCKNDTIKRRKVPNRLKKKGWEVVKAYGAIGDARVNYALCYPLSYSLDTIPFKSIASIEKLKRPYSQRDDGVEVVVLGGSLLTVLVSPLTGLSKKGYNGKAVGITAVTGVLVGFGTFIELYVKKRSLKYSLNEWEIKKVK